jgi:hypothetical protein
MKIEIEISIDKIKDLVIREYGLSDLDSECELALIGLDKDGQTTPIPYIRITNIL